MTGHRHRVALIGLGVAGTVAAHALAEMDGIEVHCGVDPLGSAALGADGSFPVCLSLEELASRGKIDLAVISVPTPLHHQVCSELLDYDIAPIVWCEKPLAGRYAKTDALMRSAANHGTELQVLLHTAFAPEVLWATRELGELAARHGPPAATSSAFHDAYLGQQDRRIASLENSWLDSGINALSVLARFFTFGELIEASGEIPLHGQASVSFHYQGHTGVASISTSWEAPISRKVTTITFEDGWSLVLEHSEAIASVLDGSSKEQETHNFGSAKLETRYRTMLEAYLGRSPLMLDGTQILTIHRRLSEAQELIEAGTDKA